MIHVHGGAILLERLAAAGIPGERLEWSEVLCDGPLGPRVDRDGRAAWLAARAGLPVAEVRARLDAQDHALDDAAGRDEVVLWFGPELFCQAILVRLLARLGGRGARLSLVSPADTPERPGCSVSQLGDDELAAALEARTPVTPAHEALAARAWASWIAPDPRALRALAAASPVTLAPLPHLGAAIRRLLDELPGPKDGLAASERAILAALAGGPRTFATLLPIVAGADARPWLTDQIVLGAIGRLAAAAPAAVRFTVPAGAHVFDAVATLTPHGDAVRRGRARHASPPRWVGGTRIG